MKNALKTAGFAVLTLATAGCNNDPIVVDNTQREEYVQNFIKNFGIPDPDHTWSMARSVKTLVDVQGLNEGTVEIFTAYPESPDARLVARLPIRNGRVSGNLPLSGATDEVFLRVKDSDNTVRMVNGLPVEDGLVTTHLRVAAAPGNDKLPKADDMELEAYIVADITRNYYYMFRDELDEEAQKNYTYAQAIDKFNNDPDYFYYPYPDNEYYKVDYLDANRHLTQIPELKFLDLYYEMGDAMSYLYALAPIFDKYSYTDPDTGESMEVDGVFREGENHIEQYYRNNTGGKVLDPNVTFSVREEGPVTMQCIWRGTQLNDYFGYFYYKEGEEPSAEEIWNVIPKYVFLTPDDITKESDLTQRNTAVTGNSYDESGWTNLDGMGVNNCETWTNQGIESYIRGRKYYLAYYGENYDEASSYTFPTGIKIGYFLYKEATQDIFFSDCKTEYELCRRTYGTEEGPYVRPFAAKFRVQGRNYVGFGDESGDCDLNDVVFIAENVYPDPVDITPDEFKEENPEKPDTPTDPVVKPQTWTLACEDLGSTDDVDFNDIVLDVAYVAGETYLTITPRAAGGTLVSEIYFREGNNADYTRLGEIHQLMSDAYAGGSGSGYPMLNTLKAAHNVDPNSVASIVVTVPEDFDLASLESGFLSRIKITTRQDDEQEYEAKEITAFTDLAESGSVPQMLLLEGDWQWPVERVDISIAYPDFKEWVKDRDAYSWTKSRRDELTVSHRSKCSH